MWALIVVSFFWGVHINTYHASFSYFIHISNVQKGTSFFDKLHFLLKPSWTWASKLRRISWVRLDPGVSNHMDGVPRNHRGILSLSG